MLVLSNFYGTRSSSLYNTYFMFFTRHHATKKDLNEASNNQMTVQSGFIRSSLRAIIFLVILVTIVSLPSLKNSFIGGDDDIFILNNPQIELPLSALPSFFVKPVGEGAASLYYRPVSTIMLFLTHKVWGNNALGFRITNLFFHLLSVIFLFHVGLLLFNKDNFAAFLAASLFAVHPALNESVGRAVMTEGLYGFFVVLAVFFFLKAKRNYSLVAYAVALFSKETAVMFPFVLAVSAMNKVGRKKWMLEVLPFAILVVFYLVARTAITGSVLGDMGALSYSRALTMAMATFHYLRLLVIPYPLHPFYPARLYNSILEPEVIFGVTTLIACAAFLYRVRKHQETTFLAAWMVLPLVPVILKTNVFVWGPDHVFIAERYLYVPAMSFSLLTAFAASKLELQEHNRRLIGSYAVVIITFSALTLSTNAIWHDGVSLHKKIVKDFPNAVFAHNNLGIALMKKERLDDASAEFRAAIKKKPDYAEAYYNLGLVSYEKGEFINAISNFNASLTIRPDYTEAQINNGNAYLRIGMFGDAIQSYKSAIRLDRNNVLAHNNLGIAYEEAGLFSEALMEYEETLRISPGYVQARQRRDDLLRRVTFYH